LITIRLFPPEHRFHLDWKRLIAEFAFVKTPIFKFARLMAWLSARFAVGVDTKFVGDGKRPHAPSCEWAIARARSVDRRYFTMNRSRITFGRTADSATTLILQARRTLRD